MYESSDQTDANCGNVRLAGMSELGPSNQNLIPLGHAIILKVLTRRHEQH